MLKKIIVIITSAAMAMSIAACSNVNTETAATEAETTKESGTEAAAGTTAESTETETTDAAYDSDYVQDNEALTFDSAAWNYDADNDVYWQIAVQYCSDPETTDYETMGIYVPGAYFDAEANSDGTYTCTVNTSGTVSGYTAETAPIVFPVNTAGYSAQAAPTSYSYSGLSDYLDAGFIYVYAGMRGRNNGDTYSGGAPWGVTDLKAAVRYYRFNSDSLPGDTDSIFVFGHSGGGAQSSVMGASGDSDLYYTYLESIGAAMLDKDGQYISDAICGAMCWCPITSLDTADEAYEWNMGQYASTGTRSDDTWTSALSKDLAAAYAEYINALELTDEDGNVLTLEESTDGVYASGTYYDYILSLINDSLNTFLANTEFPYSGSSSEMGDGGFAGAGDMSSAPDLTDGGPDGAAGLPDGALPDGDGTDITGDASGLPDGGPDSTGDTLDIMGNGPAVDTDTGAFENMEMPGGSNGNNGNSESTTYETAQDYIDALNSDEEWITYDADTNTAAVSSIEAFVNHCKSASKDVSAFDGVNGYQTENYVFGTDSSDALHFDSILASVLENNADKYAGYSDWDSSIIDEFTDVLTNTDKLGVSSEIRQNMYNPMYYINFNYDGYGTSTVCKYWRIRTGIEQGDTALTVEANLALSLEDNPDVESVDFATVWGQGHTTAEITGDSTANFINWVNEAVSTN